MQIKDYRKKYKLTLEQFGNKVDMTRHYICRLCNGHCKPTYKTAKAIFRATDGEVTIEEVLSLHKDRFKEREQERGI